MLSRFQEKRIEIERQEIPGSTGNVMELEYYLVESDQGFENPATEVKSYGIQIIKKQYGMASESIMFRDVHPSREANEKLIMLMACNTVTPATLPYIIDDLFGFDI